MGNARVLKLTSQGVLQLYDSDNSNKIGLKAPSAVGTDFNWILPAADSSGYLKSDGAGNLSLTAATATLQGAYDSGRTITVLAGKVALTGDSSLAEEVEAIVQAANHEALTLNKTGTGAGSVLKVSNGGTGVGVEVIQTGNWHAVTIAQSEPTKNCLVLSGGTFSINANKAIYTTDYLQTTNNRGLQIANAAATFKNALLRLSDDSLVLGDATVDQPLSILTGNSYVAVTANAAERLRIAADGKVGIGQTPVDNFDLYSTSNPCGLNVRVPLTVSNYGAVRFLAGTAASGATTQIGSISAIIDQTSPLQGTLRFLVNESGTPTVVMVIDHNGCVGIGTTPSQQLHVESSTYRCLQLKTSAANVAAYMEANYDIQALYLKKNTGVGNTNSVLNLDNQTTSDTITTSQGNEKLTVAGVWTSRSCFRDWKADIAPVATDRAFLDKFDRLSFQKYVDAQAKAKGAKQHPQHGLFLDDLIREFDFGGDGVSGVEVASLAVGGVKAVKAALDSLEARVAALEK